MYYKNEKINLEYSKRIIEIAIVEKYALKLNVSKTIIEENVDNFIGNGKIFNLPNNELIIGNNLSLELTTSEIELLKLYNLKKETTNQSSTIRAANTSDSSAIEISQESQKLKKLNSIPTFDKNEEFNNDTYRANLIPILNVEQPSIINITECEQILKKEYNLSEKENLIIIKGSVFKEYEQYIVNDVSYQLLSTSLMKILPLESCQKKGIKVIITDYF